MLQFLALSQYSLERDQVRHENCSPRRQYSTEFEVDGVGPVADSTGTKFHSEYPAMIVPPRRGRLPFWMNPVWIMVGWLGVAVGAWLLPPEAYQSICRTQKYIGIDAILAITLGILSFILGSIPGVMVNRWGGARRLDTLPPIGTGAAVFADNLVKLVGLGTFLLCVSAYVFWFLPTFSLSVILDALSGHISAIRQLANHVSGVTTLTQLGLPLSALSAAAIFCAPGLDRSSKYFYITILAVVTVFAFYRALLWGERLALFEVLSLSW